MKMMAVAQQIELNHTQPSLGPDYDAPGGALGSAVAGFELTSFLGRGGMADVYAAIDHQTGERVALKRMLPWLVKRRHFVELFFHEARVCGVLSHPNIVRGLDVRLDGGVPFLVLELVDGCSCGALLREVGAFPLGVALSVAHDVLAALAHVHEARDKQGRDLDIVHGDIASENVMISREGQVKILDFGVAHSRLPGGPMNATELRGRIGYVAPEHLAGTPTNAQSDLFSVGALLAEMLIGERLFGSKSKFQTTVASYNVDVSVLCAIDANVPEPLRLVLYTALSRERAQRYASAREFDQALREAARQMRRAVEDAQIHDWISRRGLPPIVSGTYPRRRSTQAPDIEAQIAALREEVDRDTAPSFSPQGESGSNTFPDSHVPRYRVRVGRHAEVRTVTHAQMVGAVVTRRVDAATPVAAISGPWIHASDLPGFSTLFTNPAYRSRSERCDSRRPFDRRELPKLLFQIAEGRERGVLEARAGSRWKRVFFDGGLPVFAASNDESELLGSCVRRLGVVNQVQLDGLISRAFFQGRRLGDVLVDAKLINPAEMLRLLLHQLEARLLELGNWTSGDIGFVRGPTSPMIAPKPLGSPMRLPCQLIRHKYPDDEIMSYLRPALVIPLCQTRALSPLDGMLTPAETQVLDKLSTPHTLASLATSTRFRPDVIRRAVFLGLSAGVVAEAAQLTDSRRGPSAACERRRRNG